jgi:hypothetical protein
VVLVVVVALAIVSPARRIVDRPNVPAEQQG